MNATRRWFYAGADLVVPEGAREHSVPAEGLHLHGEDGLDYYWCIIDWTPVCPACFAAAYTRPA